MAVLAKYSLGSGQLDFFRACWSCPTHRPCSLPLAVVHKVHHLGFGLFLPPNCFHAVAAVAAPVAAPLSNPSSDMFATVLSFLALNSLLFSSHLTTADTRDAGSQEMAIALLRLSSHPPSGGTSCCVSPSLTSKHYHAGPKLLPSCSRSLDTFS